MNARALLGKLSEVGTTAQAAVPGLYAWAITVAPASFSRGSSSLAKACGLLGPLALGAALALERKWPRAGRPAAVWGLVGTSIVAWACVPDALAPSRIDAWRGTLGMVGWGLFAFASAAPPVPQRADAIPIDASGKLRPRTDVPRGDTALILGGTALAALLQFIGWGVAVPERALLVRLVTLAASLAVIGAATDVALARHVKRPRPSKKTRLRRSTPTLIVLTALVALGLLLFLLRR